MFPYLDSQSLIVLGAAGDVGDFDEGKP